MAQAPLDPNGPSVQTSMRFPPKALQLADQLAAERGVTRSVIFREALAAYVEHEEALAS